MDNLDKEIVHKAGSVRFQGGRDTLNYSYTPSESANESSTIAYEYMFGNSMNRVAGVNLKSIDTTGVTIRYAYSPTKLNETDDITSYSEFTLQTMASRGDRIYIYLLVTPINESVPTTFTSSIKWYFGIPQTITVNNNIDGTTTTQTIVSGQEVEISTLDINVPEGYYFDAWFLDKDFTKMASATEVSLATKPLYARYANLPTDWMVLIDNEWWITYASVGESPLPTDTLVIPTIYQGHKFTALYNGSSDGIAVAPFNANNSTFTSLYLPSTLQIIYFGVFYGVNSIRYINWQSLINLSTIEHAAFHSCVGLTEVYIPASVTYIGKAPFVGCRGITSIVVDENNIHYDSRNNCNMIIRTNPSIVIQGCDNSIIPNNITQIVYYAFYNCENIETITLPNTLELIDAHAFYNCANLNNVVIPSSVKFIGQHAFGHCGNLTSLTIPDSDKWYRTTVSYDWENSINGENIILGTPSENATNFNNNYKYYYWYKV